MAGICRQPQTEPGNSELQRLLSGEINAAVQGLLEAGAEEVLVWDGHADSSTLSALSIDKAAKLVIGSFGA